MDRGVSYGGGRWGKVSFRHCVSPKFWSAPSLSLSVRLKTLLYWASGTQKECFTFPKWCGAGNKSLWTTVFNKLSFVKIQIWITDKIASHLFPRLQRPCVPENLSILFLLPKICSWAPKSCLQTSPHGFSKYAQTQQAQNWTHQLPNLLSLPKFRDWHCCLHSLPSGRLEKVKNWLNDSQGHFFTFIESFFTFIPPSLCPVGYQVLQISKDVSYSPFISSPINSALSQIPVTLHQDNSKGLQGSLPPVSQLSNQPSQCN